MKKPYKLTAYGIIYLKWIIRFDGRSWSMQKSTQIIEKAVHKMHPGTGDMKY